jgi:hypothetical protein
MIFILSLTEYIFVIDMALPLPEIGLVTLSQCMNPLMSPCDALVSSQTS